MAGAVDRGAVGLKDDWNLGTRESASEMGSGGQSESLGSEHSRRLAVITRLWPGEVGQRSPKGSTAREGEAGMAGSVRVLQAQTPLLERVTGNQCLFPSCCWNQ